MSQNGIKLSEWANQNNIVYKTAWRRFKAGQLPCRAVQYSTGTIHVFPDEPAQVGGVRVAIYARVTPFEGGGNLEKQLDRLRGFAAARGLCVDEEFSDIGFGMDGSCEGLRVLLEDSPATTIIVEHFDRLTWLGGECIEGLLRKAGKNLLVINKVPNKMSTHELEAHVIALCELHLGVEIPEKGDPDKYLLRYRLHKMGGSSTQTIDTRGEDMDQEGYNKMMAEKDAQAERVEKRLKGVTTGRFPLKYLRPKENPYVSHLEVEQQTDEQAERDEKIMEQKSDVDAPVITKVVSHGATMGIEQNVVDYTVRDQVDHDKHAKKIKEQKSDV